MVNQEPKLQIRPDILAKRRLPLHNTASGVVRRVGKDGVLLYARLEHGTTRTYPICEDGTVRRIAVSVPQEEPVDIITSDEVTLTHPVVWVD